MAPPNLSLARRRKLRRDSTPTEILLWSHLRAHRFADFKFRRQHPCGPFILDFFCPRRRLAIELDGGQHFDDEGLAHDARRDSFIAARGITVLRFPADLAFREPEAVLRVIASHLAIDAS
jgi:very-short-patch-repair endonuclease